jgi:hypothetical protein
MQGLQGGIARRVAIKGVFLAIALGLMASQLAGAQQVTLGGDRQGPGAPRRGRGHDRSPSDAALGRSAVMIRTKAAGITSALLVLFISGCAERIARPPEAPIAPNASVITGRVLQYQVALGNQKTLMVEVLTVDPLSAEPLSFISPGQVVEALTKANLSADVVGQRIRATARWTGDEWDQQLWLYNVEVLGP